MKVLKNFFYNTLYQIIILFVPLISTPYVSRVLGVTNIGIYQYTQSIATYFTLVGAAGTTLYGQREIAYLQDKPLERSIAFWEIEITRIVSVVLFSLVYFFLFCIRGKYIEIYLILLVEVIATAFDISWLYMGMENFRLTVFRNLIIRITGMVSIFIFVKSISDLEKYTICLTIPLLIGNISLWISLRKYIIRTSLTTKEIIRGIVKRLRPIFILFLPQIAIDIYTVLDKTMIGALASDIKQVGYYSQAQKIIKLILMIITSLGTVMLPAMSSAYARGDNERLINSIKKAFKFVYMISFALAFGLCAIAPWFVPLFFGSGYDEVIVLMMVISPVLVIIATSNVIGRQYLIPTNQNRKFTVSILIGAGVNASLNLLLIPRMGALGASIATVIAELAVSAAQCISVWKQLDLKNSLLSGIKYGLLGVIMFVFSRGVGLIAHLDNFLSILLVAFVGGFIYIVALIASKDEIIFYAVDIIMNKKSKQDKAKLR